MEIQPGVPEVVHHVLVFIGGENVDLENTAGFLAAYVPGNRHQINPEGFAKWLPPGAELYFQMHYTPNGTATEDLSYVGFRFADSQNVRRLLRGRIAINQEFVIPAGAASHQVTAEYVSQEDEELLSMTPHMHLRGKAFRYDVRFPDGSEQTLLNVPNYDFNWQLKYVLESPLFLPKGTRILCTAVFDNSKYNLTNPDPTRPVGWGDQSFEEMMIGFMDTVPVASERPSVE